MIESILVAVFCMVVVFAVLIIMGVFVGIFSKLIAAIERSRA